MIYIRTDGNEIIATGHVMRCLSIANAARSLKKQVTFLTADRQMEPLLRQQGFPSICLDTVWKDLDQETEKMEALIRQKNMQTLLIDSYFVTPDYLRRLHQLTHVAYLDDLNAFPYPCSTLINYNIYADKLDYPGRYPHTRLLLGPGYAPLREEFQHLPKRVIRDKVERVLVTTGGSDPYNVAGQVVRLAKQTPQLASLEYHLAVGRFNQNLPMLEQLAREHKGVLLHHNTQNMAKLMMDCDLAISAGGSTLYELCATGTPAILFTWADNQLEALSAFGEGLMINAGDVREDPDQTISRILDALDPLCRDQAKRKEISRRIMEVADGSGAWRIAHALSAGTAEG